MFVIKFIIFGLVAWDAVNEARGLVELPKVEDNYIQKAELIIRTTTNTLFSNLKMRTKKSRPKLEYFSLVHGYLTTLTLQDFTTLTEIAKLTRVDKKTINSFIQDFMVVLKEILDDDGLSNLAEDDNVTKVGLLEADDFFDNYILRDAELKRKKLNSSAELEIDMQILELLLTDGSDFEAERTTNDTEDLEVWTPPSTLNTRRVFNGQRTKIKYFPFVASVHIFEQFMCSGSIIKSDLIITAASCLQLAWNNRFFRENPAFLSVRVGSTFYTGTGEKIAVGEVYFHPSYVPRTLQHNLAIMRLTRHIKFKKRHVQKINIDRQASSLPYNTDGILILGWGARSGANEIESPVVNRLAADYLDAYPLEDCMDVYSKEYVKKQNFCAGFMSKGGGACNRDVGGPGVVGGVLTGVVSFGSPVCGAIDAPTVFTKVGYYADWIDGILKQEIKIKKTRTTRLPLKYTYSPASVSVLRDTELLIEPIVETTQRYTPPKEAIRTATTKTITTTKTRSVKTHTTKINLEHYPIHVTQPMTEVENYKAPNSASSSFEEKWSHSKTEATKNSKNSVEESEEYKQKYSQSKTQATRNSKKSVEETEQDKQQWSQSKTEVTINSKNTVEETEEYKQPYSMETNEVSEDETQRQDTVTLDDKDINRALKEIVQIISNKPKQQLRELEPMKSYTPESDSTKKQELRYTRNQLGVQHQKSFKLPNSAELSDNNLLNNLRQFASVPTHQQHRSTKSVKTLKTRMPEQSPVEFPLKHTTARSVETPKSEELPSLDQLAKLAKFALGRTKGEDKNIISNNTDFDEGILSLLFLMSQNDKDDKEVKSFLAKQNNTTHDTYDALELDESDEEGEKNNPEIDVGQELESINRHSNNHVTVSEELKKVN